MSEYTCELELTIREQEARIAELEKELSRYAGAVEVEGIIGRDAFHWTTFTFDENHPKLEGQRVKVLVIPKEVE